MKKRFLLWLTAAVTVVMFAVASCTPVAETDLAPSSLIPSANNTYNLGHASRGWADLYLYGENIYTDNGTLTLPQDVTDTLVGKTTTDTLTNKTLTSPTLTTPTITGTSVIANHASGNATSNADGRPTIVITHGLASIPNTILATWGSDPSGDPGIFISSANATYFTINATTANLTGGTTVYWIAYIVDE